MKSAPFAYEGLERIFHERGRLAVGKHFSGIRKFMGIEGAAQPAPGFLVPPREQVEDSQCGMGASVAVVDHHRQSRRLAGVDKRLGRILNPPKGGLKIIGI